MRTRTAIGDLNGKTYVFFYMNGERSTYGQEAPHDEHPYLQFVNAKTFPELMASLDRLYENEDTPPLFPFLGTLERPSLTTDAKKIARTVDSCASRRQIERVRDCLGLWAFGDKTPDDAFQADIEKRVKMKSELNRYRNPSFGLYSEESEDNHWKPFLPLEDIVTAKNDLYLTSRLLCWLMDKTSFEAAHGLGDVDTVISRDERPALPLIDVHAKSTVGDYYSGLASREQNKMAQHLLIGPDYHVARMNEYREGDIRDDVASYVECAFSMMLSDVHEDVVIERGKKPRWIANNATLLSDMWSFMAEHICKEPGKDAITVCPFCGKLFQQVRKTKKYCNKTHANLGK